MNKKDFLIIILIIILVGAIIFSFCLVTGVFNSFQEKNTLGSESYGSVEVLGPYGNTSSNVVIGYVVGLHPRENATHQAFIDTFFNIEDLNYCYYIYCINVTEGVEDYETSRMNGQLLAQSYVLPDALDKNLTLLVDIHSNGGNWEENEFMFSPLSGGKGEMIAREVLENCTFSTYYFPPNPTSHVYLTLPLNQAGIPAFFFEEFDENSPELMRIHLKALILTIDNLEF